MPGDLFDELQREWNDAGKPEALDSWLSTYCFVDDNAYTRAVASKPLIAAVRRVRHPGSPFKYMPVLEGAQDARKSSALRKLALDRYFDDNLEFGKSTKEIMEISSGVLIHEVPELSRLKDNQIETVKAMMSRQKDKARMAYGRTTTVMERQFIMWGTSNDRKYLRDATGNVRFWPVWSNATIDKPIDTDGLGKVARLLWGEAAFREAAGETPYLEGEALRLQNIAVNDRYDGDTNYDKLSDALEGKKGFVSSEAAYDICEIIDERARQSPAVAKSVKNAMTKLGWQKGRVRLVKGDGTKQHKRGWLKEAKDGTDVLSWWEWDVTKRGLVAVKRRVKEAKRPDRKGLEEAAASCLPVPGAGP